MLTFEGTKYLGRFEGRLHDIVEKDNDYYNKNEGKIKGELWYEGYGDIKRLNDGRAFPFLFKSTSFSSGWRSHLKSFYEKFPRLELFILGIKPLVSESGFEKENNFNMERIVNYQALLDMVLDAIYKKVIDKSSKSEIILPRILIPQRVIAIPELIERGIVSDLEGQIHLALEEAE